MDLQTLIKSGESETIEFKEKFDDRTVESAVAFANAKGGMILIGVSDKGNITGVDIGKETLAKWANQISDKTEPKLIPEIEVLEFEGKKVVVVNIPEYPIKPVSVRGRCFKRVNNSNRSMNSQEIVEVHMESTVYYHVRITQKSHRVTDELKLDLSEEKLRSQLLTPYENGDNIVVNGKTITPDDIERIKINKTEFNSSKLIPIVRAKRPKNVIVPQISDEWLVTEEGEDVTDNLIKGEPGYMKKKLGEKMEEVKPKTNEIFIVHGHDDGMKEAVARTLKDIGLEPIILHEQANRGKTIIEKFENCSENVSFAVVLLSPDDKGYKKDQEPESASYRARQNVILELGYFLGKLGRENVCALLKTEENFEFPSDIFGSLYTLYDSNSGWKLALAKELKAAGYDIDFGKL